MALPGSSKLKNKADIYYGSGNPFSVYAPTCTWYAFGRFCELQGISASKMFAKGGYNGNGGAWYGYALRHGKQVSKKPAVGAIVCWSRSGEYSGQSTLGHVACVEQVYPDGRIAYSENYEDMGMRAHVVTDVPDDKGRLKYYGSYKTFQGYIYPEHLVSPDLQALLGAVSETGSEDDNDLGYNIIRDLPYGEEVVEAMKAYVGKSAPNTEESNGGVKVLYNAFKDCGLAASCFNLKALGKSSNKWTYEDAYTWLQKNGTLIYDYEKDLEDNNDFKLIRGGDVVFLSNGNNDYTKFGGIGVVEDMPTSATFMSLDVIVEYQGVIKKQNRKKKTIHTVIRPPYGVVEGGLRVPVYAELLESGELYDYVVKQYDENIVQRLTKTSNEEIRDLMKQSKEAGLPEGTPLSDDIAVSVLSSSGGRGSERNAQTVFQGDFASTSKLPTSLALIEAPYIKVKIGGEEIGTWSGRDKPSNYIDGLYIRKTNTSLNEYTIRLVHQISPGDNPNYIDELLSINSYKEIEIMYGDAEGGLDFKDVKALLIGAQTSFDFENCKISYTISATSSAMVISTYKTNYEKVEDKPSNVIRHLIANESVLTQAFPAMSNPTFVDSKNLIPNSDKVVKIPAYTDITPLNYIRKLTNLMTNNLEKTDTGLSSSVYVFTLDDNASGQYFRITEVNANENIDYMNIAYEVDVGYPDSAQVYSFNVDTDYAWAMSYNYAEGVNRYKYKIDDMGNITSNLSKSVFSSNWWTKMTEYPITAKLTTRGLVSPMLLMSYIKINSTYFGSPRITSGVYVVVGQTDELSGQGFRTTLDLIRVAGANEYVSVDGRVIT